MRVPATSAGDAGERVQGAGGVTGEHAVGRQGDRGHGQLLGVLHQEGRRSKPLRLQPLTRHLERANRWRDCSLCDISDGISHSCYLSGGRGRRIQGEGVVGQKAGQSRVLPGADCSPMSLVSGLLTPWLYPLANERPSALNRPYSGQARIAVVPVSHERAARPTPLSHGFLWRVQSRALAVPTFNAINAINASLALACLFAALLTLTCNGLGRSDPRTDRQTHTHNKNNNKNKNTHTRTTKHQ